MMQKKEKELVVQVGIIDASESYRDGSKLFGGG